MYGEVGGLVGGIVGNRAGGLSNLMCPKKKNKTVRYPYILFGGTGNDYIQDIKRLSTGELIVVVTTTSTTFAGIDISAYTDGVYQAFGILKIDASLPNTGFLLGSYWVNGNGKIFGTNSGPKVSIDGSDNIYYTMGSNSSTASDVKAYKVRASDMTLVATANKALTEDMYKGTYGYYCYYYHQCQVMGNYLYVHYGCYRVGYWTRNAMQKLNLSNLTRVSDDIYYLDSTQNGAAGDVISNGTSLYVHGCQATVITKMSATPSVNAILAEYTAHTAWNPLCITYESSNVYWAILNDISGKRRCRVYAAKNDLSGTKTGWSSYGFSATEPDNTSVGRPNIYKDNVDDKLLLLWATSKNATGTQDLSWYEINPANGSKISENWVRYNNGDRLGQAAKAWVANAAPIRKETGKYFVAASTTADVVGYATLGNNSCFIGVVDNTGKMEAAT